MITNKKAQVSVVAFMLAIVLVILGVALAWPTNQATTNSMNATLQGGESGSGMNCSATTNDFVKAACWTADIGQGFFIGSIIALAGVLIGARVLVQGL